MIWALGQIRARRVTREYELRELRNYGDSAPNRHIASLPGRLVDDRIGKIVECPVTAV